MSDPIEGLEIRPVTELDISAISDIDERISGTYREEIWENRITYALRRDPEGSLAAVIEGEVVGFMLGEVRFGEFGLTEKTGWIEVMGVDPDHRRKDIGRHLAEKMLDHFRRNGAKTVRTLVEGKRDDLLRFFQAVGFENADLRAFVYNC